MGLRIGQHGRSVQRQIDKTVSKISDSMRHLASGKRVDRAYDDPASSIMAESFTTEIKGTARAARNAYDGANLARQAEATLGQITDIIQAMRVLAVQAASDIQTDADRANLQVGAKAYADEVESIGSQASFAGINLLDGSFADKALHIGSGFRDAPHLAIADHRAQYLGRYAVTQTERVTSDALERGDVVINGVRVRAAVDADDNLSSTMKTSSAIAKAEAINDSSALSNVAAFVEANEYDGAADIMGGTLDGSNYISINGEIISGFSARIDDADERLLDAINQRSEQSGVTAQRNRQGRLRLTAEDGRNIHIEAIGQGHVMTGLLSNAGDHIQRARLTLFSEDLFTVSDPNNAGGEAKIGVDEDEIIGPNELDVLGTVDISTRRGANRALVILDRTEEAVLRSRSKLGGLEKRLGFTVSRLNDATMSTHIAKGKVIDADIAKETATLTKDRIVQTAFSTVLAQANQESFRVLQLL